MSNGHANLDRFALGSVHADNEGVYIEPNFDNLDLSIEDYSRFKYGDGAVSRVYGNAIARLLIPNCLDIEAGQDLYVTSSAYKIARPASASMVEPFVGMAQAVARSHGYRGRVVPFKINRANLTDGDYATMSAEERDAVMRRNGLSLPEGVNIEESHVIALDDIRVTGSHEVSLDEVLRKNGAAHVTHAYILDVPNGKSDPTLEARINQAAVRDIDDLMAVASLKHFTSNARYGKRILTEPPENIQRFCGAMSLRITSRIIYDAIGDGLDKMPRYEAGFNTFVDAMADANLST